MRFKEVIKHLKSEEEVDQRKQLGENLNAFLSVGTIEARRSYRKERAKHALNLNPMSPAYQFKRGSLVAQERSNFKLLNNIITSVKRKSKCLNREERRQILNGYYANDDSSSHKDSIIGSNKKRIRKNATIKKNKVFRVQRSENGAQKDIQFGGSAMSIQLENSQPKTIRAKKKPTWQIKIGGSDIFSENQNESVEEEEKANTTMRKFTSQKVYNLGTPPAARDR